MPILAANDYDALAQLDIASLMHPLTSIEQIEVSGPQIYGAASGIRIDGPFGKSMLDFGAGLWCVNVGYGRKELVDAGAEALTRLSYYHIFGGASNEPTIRLADRVLSLLRDGAGLDMARVFFGTSGSDANDTAYKLVKYYNVLRGKPEKRKILSRMGGYHGVTAAAAKLTGIPAYHTNFGLDMSDVVHLSCPHSFRFATVNESEEAFTSRMIAEMKEVIAREGANNIAAFIAEPVMGTGGVLIPPRGYFEAVQQVLDENDILLIVDEVITGFGRLGNWFGSGHYGLRPDIISLAKGITSAYFPLSANVLSHRIFDVLREASPQHGPVMHGFTYSGHPVGCAIALANLDIVEREDLVTRARLRGTYMLDALRNAVGDFPYTGEVRGEGLMLGVELVADPASRRLFTPGQSPHRVIARHAMQTGVLVRALPYLEVNSFSPPLIVSESEIDEGVAAYAAAYRAALPELDALAAQG